MLFFTFSLFVLLLYKSIKSPALAILRNHVVIGGILIKLVYFKNIWVVEFFQHFNFTQVLVLLVWGDFFFCELLYCPYFFSLKFRSDLVHLPETAFTERLFLCVSVDVVWLFLDEMFRLEGGQFCTTFYALLFVG